METSIVDAANNMRRGLFSAALLMFVSAGLLTAQSFRVVYNFSGAPSVYASGRLLVHSNTIYGTTQAGGVYGSGSVFKIGTDGGGFQILKSFPTTVGGTNIDGTSPLAGLVLSSNRLFGTTVGGGIGGQGTVFCLDTNGGQFRVLVNFSGPNGKAPYTGLTLSSNILYGATAAGGVSNKGAVYRLNTDGTDYQLLKSFSTNDGFLLLSGLTLNSDGSTLFGATYGGNGNNGSVYRLRVDGTGFATLKNFADGQGSQPRNSLVVLGDTVFGTTEGNLSPSNAVVYAVKTNGNASTVLKTFSETSETGTNSDGASPFFGGLVAWNGVLYGTTYDGGFYGSGVVYKINPDGTGFAVLKHFAPAGTNSPYANIGGYAPVAELTVDNGVLYGTTRYGGTYGAGVIYAITIPPIPSLQVTNAASGPAIYWNDDGLSRTLQTCSDLSAAEWTNVSPLNWTNAVNAPEIGYQMVPGSVRSAQFFRLK
jgi:uncharacterized repeat protein (TIGR03803 family)